MNLRDYKSGHLTQQYQYKSFTPTKINHPFTWDDPKINLLLADANKKIGELNAFSLYVPDIEIFIQMHVAKESVTSSKIEGTKTEIDEVFLEEEEIQPEKKDDWQEVRNYIKAMNTCLDELAKLPISTRMLNLAHEILLDNARGEHKSPGEFRRSQNWIGGATIKDALFIPPHFEEVPELMGDLENFLHNEELEIPHLIKAAIAHYQFETIHPYLDGNGRIGRLLITLYLVSCGLLAKPTLYLSAYFEKHRGFYIDNLMFVREKNDLKQWIAENGIQTFQKILALKEEIEANVLPAFGGKIRTARSMINFLYRAPFYVTASNVAKNLNITPATANSLIKSMEEKGVLEKIYGEKRNRVYVFTRYIKLFMDNKHNEKQG
jgi:Fic family protein